MSSTKFVFFGPIGKTRWPLWPLIGRDIFDFSSETAKGIQRNLTGSKITTSSTKFVFLGQIGKTRWPPWPLIGWTFSTSPLKPLNRIQRNLTGSKISTSSAKFVFLGPIRKNKMATLASDWLRHFQLLLWNRWTKFNETWQKTRSQCFYIPNLCFSGHTKNGPPGRSVKKVAHCTQVHNMWPFGPLVSWLEPKSLCFLGQFENTDGCPGPD